MEPNTNQSEALDATPEPQIIRQIRTEDDVTVVEVQGEVDLATTSQLASALYEAGMVSLRVIADLSGVTYMDSSGFGTLLGATKKLRPGGRLYLIGCSTNIARMLQITRLNTVFSIHRDEAEARAAFLAPEGAESAAPSA